MMMSPKMWQPRKEKKLCVFKEGESSAIDATFLAILVYLEGDSLRCVSERNLEDIFLPSCKTTLEG